MACKKTVWLTSHRPSSSRGALQSLLGLWPAHPLLFLLTLLLPFPTVPGHSVTVSLSVVLLGNLSAWGEGVPP